MHRDERPRRPALSADLTELIDAAGGVTPSSRAEVAAATAAVLVQAGRDPAERGGDDRFVALADRIGLDTLAALWKGSDPVSLPGALWALYLLRQWFRGSPDEVCRLWRAGAPLMPADAIVAGIGDPADTDALARVADAIIAGVYRGELDVALERAAASFRVVAAGRRDLAGGFGDGSVVRGGFGGGSGGGSGDDAEMLLAERNERVAADLATAAERWRRGTLG